MRKTFLIMLVEVSGVMATNAKADQFYSGQDAAVTDSDNFTMRADCQRVRCRLRGVDSLERGWPGYGRSASRLAGLVKQGGEPTNDIFAFLTTEPNAEVGAIHPKAKPVILTETKDIATWMIASSMKQ